MDDELEELDSPALEEARALVVAAACAALEAAMPSSLEEDIRRLATAELPQGERLLVELRLSRKRLLRDLRASVGTGWRRQPVPTAFPHLSALERLENL